MSTLANSTWYFKLSYGSIVSIKFGPQTHNGGTCQIGPYPARWAESDGLFTVELDNKYGTAGYTTVWTGEVRGGVGSGFASPLFNGMAFTFTMSQIKPTEDFQEDADWMKDMAESQAAA